MDHSTRRSLREDRLHGDDSFPLAAYWVDRPAGEYVLDCHWHEEAEFFFVLQGAVLFQVDTEYIPVRAGEAVFIDGGDIHAGHSLGDDGCSYCAVVFDPHMLDSAGYDAVQQSSIAPLQDRSRSFPRHIRPGVDWHRSLLRSLEGVVTVYEEQSVGFQTAVKAHLLLMLHGIAADGRSVNRRISSPSDQKIERLKRVITFMQHHYDRPIRIQELAEQVPMSEGQFCRFFKSMTRQTPVEYLNSYRVKRATELLLQSDRKISDIAMEVGFEHISYFVKVFQRNMRATPSQFRKGNGARRD